MKDDKKLIKQSMKNINFYTKVHQETIIESYLKIIIQKKNEQFIKLIEKTFKSEIKSNKKVIALLDSIKYDEDKLTKKIQGFLDKFTGKEHKDRKDM